MGLNTTTSEMRVKFFWFLNFDNVTIEMAAVTLRNGSRSNG